MATKISTPNSIRFLFPGWMKSDIYKRKVDTRDELLAVWTLLLLLPARRRLQINSDRQYAIFAHQLTVGFSNIYCKM
jgi:hypothetical protein